MNERISAAAEECGLTPRMLRYRQGLGLLPLGVSAAQAGKHRSSGHRRFSRESIAALRRSVATEDRYDLTPSQLAAAIRVLTDAEFRGAVRTVAEDLGRLPRRIEQSEVDRERALHWLGRSGVLGPNLPR